MFFDFILKPAGDICNISCTYCYYRQDKKGNLQSKRWSFEFAQQVLEKIARFEVSRGHSVASVTWHGGEPLILGLDWYKAIINYQRTLPIVFKNTFQTNGILLNSSWCTFFKQNDISLGISFDGPEHIHNIFRVKSTKEGTFQDVFSSIKTCQENAIDFGVLSVVTEESAKHVDEILDFFVGNKIFHFDFLPAFLLKDTNEISVEETNILPSTYTKFMKRVFDWYIAKNDPSIQVRTIVSIMERILEKKGSVCTVGADDCGSNLTIGVGGDIVFCDDYNAHVRPNLGNITTDALEDIIGGDAFQSIVATKNLRRQQCVDCLVLDICGGGCPRYWNNGKNYFCEHYQDFYLHVNNTMNEILELSL